MNYSQNKNQNHKSVFNQINTVRVYIFIIKINAMVKDGLW